MLVKCYMTRDKCSKQQIRVVVPPNFTFLANSRLITRYMLVAMIILQKSVL